MTEFNGFCLKAGKRYLRRDGSVSGPLVPFSNGGTLLMDTFVYDGLEEKGNLAFPPLDEGDHGKGHAFDLVGEVPE